VIGYATVAEPLTNLLRKDVEFRWMEAQDKAFCKLRKALVGDAVHRACHVPP